MMGEGAVDSGGVGGRGRTSTRRFPYDSGVILEVTIGEMNRERCDWYLDGSVLGGDG